MEDYISLPDDPSASSSSSTTIVSSSIFFDFVSPQDVKLFAEFITRLVETGVLKVEITRALSLPWIDLHAALAKCHSIKIFLSTLISSRPMDFFMDSMSKFVDDASPYALACVSAVQELLDVTITSEMGDQQCCICTNSILIGKKGKQMPYGHLHHRDCLLS